MNTAQKLRSMASRLRATSMPLADIIPLLQKAADELDRTATAAQPTDDGPTWEQISHAWYKVGADLKGLDWGAFTNAIHYAPARCPHCDGTGDVHSIDGHWRGRCVCEAGNGIKEQP